MGHCFGFSKTMSGYINETSHNVRKRTFRYVRPAKIQISLRIRVVRSESSLGIFWIAKDANNEKGLKDCLWKQTKTIQIDNGSLGFIKTLHKQQ